jgi:CHAD domain-containing protein
MSAAASAANRSPVAEPAAEALAAPPVPPDAATPDAVTLEFALPHAAAARVARLPFVQAHRAGRARTAAAETIWSDSPDGALSAEGLILEAPRRGKRLLRRLLPLPDAAWHPAQPAGIDGVYEANEGPPLAEDAPLVAVAAFTGRRQSFGLDLPEGTAGVVLLTGRLRSVAAEREVARVCLTGPLPAVIAAAHGIAAELPLAPPLVTLAEEARAMAGGTPPRPHRLGPPDTGAATTTEDAFLRAVGHLLEVLHQQAARIRHGGGPEAVHQSRVALRRLRSVLRVFRDATDGPELRSLDARLREVVAVLGPARDWDVFLAGTGREVGTAFAEDARVAALLRAAEAKRSAAYDAALAMVGAPGWRALLIDALAVLLARPWRDTDQAEQRAAQEMPARAFGRMVLDRRWSRLRRAGAEFATLSAEQLHELRLDGKRLRYAAEVFAPLFDDRRARRFLRRLGRLQDGLGIANDAAVARGLARALSAGAAGRSWAVGCVEGWCEARVAVHRDDALAAWRRLSGKDRFWTGD